MVSVLVDDTAGVDRSEAMRALTPRGIVIAKGKVVATKPVPKDVDAPVAVEAGLEVGTRTETTPFAGQNDGAHGGVISGALQRIVQVRAKRIREAVERVRSIEADNCDRILLLVTNSLCHCLSPVVLLAAYMLRRYSPPTS